MFFTLTTWQLALAVFAVIGLGCAIGAVVGHVVGKRSETVHQPIGVLQGALLGVVGLILAFGLSLAVGRYQGRRTDVVTDANAIGTAYLRAQTIAEPQRTRSLALLRTYADLAIRIAHEVPSSTAQRATVAQQGAIQQSLWRLAGETLNEQPQASAPRLYVDSLNAMIDEQAVRVSGLNNRVPDAVLWLELLSAALALGLLALYLAALGEGLVTVVVAALLVSLLVLVTFDLDRPTRGFIIVPDRALVSERASMSLPPAAPAPRSP